MVLDNFFRGLWSFACKMTLYEYFCDLTISNSQKLKSTKKVPTLCQYVCELGEERRNVHADIYLKPWNVRAERLIWGISSTSFTGEVGTQVGRVRSSYSESDLCFVLWFGVRLIRQL